MLNKTIALVLASLLAACSSSGMSHLAPGSAAAPACQGGVVHDDAELQHYAGCTSVAGDLDVEGVTTLSPLSDLRNVEGTLRIRDTTRLYNLAGLERLGHVTELFIERNRALISGASLNRLTQAQAVRIAGNPRLSRAYGLLRGLRAGSSALRIENNAGLTAEGLASLPTLGSQPLVAQR
jgi:hypothetical protein